MTAAKALKQYLEGDLHVPGQKCGLDEMQYLLGSTSKNYTGLPRAEMVAELRSYGFEITED